MKRIIKNIARKIGVEITRYLPSTSEASQLNKLLLIAKIDIVFDIGANRGQFAKIIRRAGYKGKIISFEPISAARNKLIDFVKNDSNWVIHDRCAIGDFDGDIVINISRNSVSSSILPMKDLHSDAAENSIYISREQTPIFKLDSLAERYLNSDSNLFLKIDTQGYEWQVFDGAYQTLKRTRGIICELSLVDLYEGQRLWREIIDRLEAQGFMLWAIQKGFTDPRTGQTLQIDGIFLRKSIITCME